MAALRKQLQLHLEAAFAEIERLSGLLDAGLGALEAATRADLSVAGAGRWFALYLRLVDLALEIRRGERRHRTCRPITHACMHTTGTKGARHSGLSIDDANAIYQALEASRGVRESLLETYFMRMDALDRDGVGRLDTRLAEALQTFLRTPSAAYVRLELSGSDPHQELAIHLRSPSSAATDSVHRVTRVCYNVETCVCPEDAEPWVDFTVETVPAIPTDHAAAASTSSPDAGSSSALAEYTEDMTIGLAELKRQFGFEATISGDDEDEDDGGIAAAHKRRRLPPTAASAARGPQLQPPREIYRRLCQERGVQRRRKVDELFAVKQGGLSLDLSQFGFHAPQDLQDILNVVTEAQLPIRLLDVTNNFFDTRSFELLSDLLRLPLLRQHIQTLNLRCMALPQRPDFAVVLRILTDAEAGTLSELRHLDLSYNTFFEDAVLSLNDLLGGLTHLETLSLESCFPKAPDPGVVEVAVVKDLVRSALVTSCHRLKHLNFGSNWMSFPLLNSLFSPESALERLELSQMTFFYFEAPDSPPISWNFCFQRQLSVVLSETKNSRCEYLPFFLDALTYCLKMRMAHIRDLDLSIIPLEQRKTDFLTPELRLEERVAGALEAMTEYGSMETIKLRYDLGNSTNAHCRRAVAQLLRGGLRQCVTCEMYIGVPLTLMELRNVLDRVNAPVLRSLKLSVTLLNTPTENAADAKSLNFSSVFWTSLGAVTELVLEFKVELKASKSLLPDSVVQEMETAWRSLPSANPKTRTVSLVKRKPRRDRSGEGNSGAGSKDFVTFALLFTAPA